MHTVREFATLAFKEAGIELRWEGEGVNEKGIDVATGKSLVEVDPKYFRPSEVEQLLGDPTKAKTLLGWDPRKTSFETGKYHGSPRYGEGETNDCYQTLKLALLIEWKRMQRYM